MSIYGERSSEEQVGAEMCENCMGRPAPKRIENYKGYEIAEVCDECVRYYMRTVVDRDLRP